MVSSMMRSQQPTRLGISSRASVSLTLDVCVLLCRTAAGVTSPGSGPRPFSAGPAGTALPLPSRLPMSSHKAHMPPAATPISHHHDRNAAFSPSQSHPDTVQFPTSSPKLSTDHQVKHNVGSTPAAIRVQDQSVSNQLAAPLEMQHQSAGSRSNTEALAPGTSLAQTAAVQRESDSRQQLLVLASPMLHPRNNSSEPRPAWSSAPRHSTDSTQKHARPAAYPHSPATIPRHKSVAMSIAETESDSALLASAERTDSLPLLNRLVDNAAQQRRHTPGQGPMVSTWNCAVAAAEARRGTTTSEVWCCHMAGTLKQ